MFTYLFTYLFTNYRIVIVLKSKKWYRSTTNAHRSYCQMVQRFGQQ